MADSIDSSLSPLRSLVSKKKIRFQEDGYDLDLTYITPNIIAMGFPSQGAEATYRNPIEKVAKFLNTRHANTYKVYNLCSEKDYDPIFFNGNVEKFGFDDHNCPSFGQIIDFCGESMHYLLATAQTLDLHLDKSEHKTCVAIHCKAGKGRTGLMICCLMMHACLFFNANDSLEYYGNKRTSNGKGVTIPSQRRYVHYYDEYLQLTNEDKIVNWERTMTTLYRVKFHGIPKFDIGGGCDPYFKITRVDGKLFYDSRKHIQVPNLGGAEKECILDCDASFYGDVKFLFCDADPVGKDDKMFAFWINPCFIKNNYLCLTQNELDGAVKDKNNEQFPVGFKIELFFKDATTDVVEALSSMRSRSI